MSLRRDWETGVYLIIDRDMPLTDLRAVRVCYGLNEVEQAIDDIAALI